jgi:hypothetical protein
MRIFLFLLFLPAAFGQLFSAGIKIGAPLTDSFSDVTLPSAVNLGGSIRTYSDAKKFVVGPQVELHLPFGFSINADGLYRPLRLVTASAPTPIAAPGINSANYASWEVTPALRYRFLHTPIVKPFAEAGPSFRWVDTPLDKNLSNRGFTLGAGVEVKLFKIRVTPELRFTRWGSDHNVSTLLPLQSAQNQAEFLAGFSF